MSAWVIFVSWFLNLIWSWGKSNIFYPTISRIYILKMARILIKNRLCPTGKQLFSGKTSNFLYEVYWGWHNFIGESIINYRVSQKDRYDQIWIFGTRGRILSHIFFHGNKHWLFSYTKIISLFAYLYPS